MIKSRNVKIYTLCENSVATAGVTGEWGYSLYIQVGDRAVLFDTGSSGTTAMNAVRMGVDLSKVDAIVLSHGHYDHTGGLLDVLAQIRREVPIIAHPDVFGLKYSYNKKKDTYRFAGIPYRREQIESSGGRFELTAEPYRIMKDMVTSGEEPQKTDYETIADNLCLKTENRYVPDPMADDLSIFLNTDLGLVVILGCAHRGMINIIRHGMELMGTEELYMVLGGTHLVTADSDRLDKTVRALRDMDPRWIGTSHCTGFEAAATLYNAFTDKFFVNSTGSVITFPYEG